MRTTYRLLATILLSILLWNPIAAFSAVPQTLGYQGQLNDSSGMPVNGTITAVFSLYDIANDGKALWTETQSVIVTNGQFNVVLGKIAPIDLPFDAPYYLGIKIGSDSEVTPRQPLTSAGSSLMAKQAGALNCVGCVTKENLADNVAISGPAGPPGANGAPGRDATIPTGFMILGSSSTPPSGFTYTGDMIPAYSGGRFYYVHVKQ